MLHMLRGGRQGSQESDGTGSDALTAGAGDANDRAEEMRNRSGGYVNSGPEGMVVKVRLANGPVCDSSIAPLAGSRATSNSFLQVVWIGVTALCCQPRLASGSSKGLESG